MQKLQGQLLTWVAVAGMATAAVGAEVGFRNDGMGAFADVKPPLSWSATTNIVWTVKLKESNACPIVVGDKVIVGEEPDAVRAFSLRDGAELWTVHNGYADVLSAADLEARKAEKQPGTHGVNGRTTPTPVTDGKAVYVVTCNGVVAGLGLDGKRLWGKLLPVPPHHKEWGHSASPRLAGNRLLVHFGNKVFALDVATGKELWTVDSPSGFGSPVLTKVGDTEVLITIGGDVCAVADGRKLATKLFKFPWNGPVVADGNVYKVDEDGAMAYSLASLATAATTPPAPLWKVAVPKERYYSTPVVTDGLIYNVTRSGRLVVLDAKTGEMVYEKRLEFGGGNTTTYPSPVLGGGRIYVSGDNGTTVVLKPGRNYEELGRNTFAPFRSCPYFVGESMLIRANSGLYLIK